MRPLHFKHLKRWFQAHRLHLVVFLLLALQQRRREGTSRGTRRQKKRRRWWRSHRRHREVWRRLCIRIAKREGGDTPRILRDHRVVRVGLQDGGNGRRPFFTSTAPLWRQSGETPHGRITPCGTDGGETGEAVLDGCGGVAHRWIGMDGHSHHPCPNWVTFVRHPHCIAGSGGTVCSARWHGKGRAGRPLSLRCRSRFRRRQRVGKGGGMGR